MMRRQWCIWGHGILKPELQDGCYGIDMADARAIAIERYGNVLPPALEDSVAGGYIEPGLDADGDLVWRNTAVGERLECGRAGLN